MPAHPQPVEPWHKTAANTYASLFRESKSTVKPVTVAKGVIGGHRLYEEAPDCKRYWFVEFTDHTPAERDKKGVRHFKPDEPHIRYTVYDKPNPTKRDKPVHDVMMGLDTIPWDVVERPVRVLQDMDSIRISDGVLRYAHRAMIQALTEAKK